MRFPTVAKVAILIALGVCSSLVTSRIIAQTRETITKGKEGKGAKRAAANANSNQFIVASVALGKMDVTARDGKVSVSAGVTARDSRQTYSYLWNVLITDIDMTHTIVNINYDRQLFSLQPGKSYQPTFNDKFSLEPGNYRVELRLFQVDANTNLQSLMNSRGHHEDLVVSGVRMITLNN